MSLLVKMAVPAQGCQVWVTGVTAQQDIQAQIVKV
jgi:hypothetical protein